MGTGETLRERFSKDAREGLQHRMRKELSSGGLTEKEAEKYSERLEHEINLIQEMGFSGYFLIVADFINFARRNDIPVGPGRGSAAGSLAAYSLGITDIDPIRVQIAFRTVSQP